MSCPELAATLSENYRRCCSSNSGDSLRDYLSTHGLLLTMCVPNGCALGFYDQFVSSSWIQQDVGTSRIIPAASGIGLLLDHLVANVKCIYPTDAGSDGRDGLGCGPTINDPKFGSQGAAYYDKHPEKSK